LNPAFASLHASDFEVVELGWKPPSGSPPATLGFYTLTPCRLLDTRSASGASGGPALPPTSERILAAAGHCGIPDDAKAISVNVTAVGAPQAGYLRLYAGNAVPASTSALNFAAGQTRANNAVVTLSTSGTGTFAVQNGAPSQAVHVVVDVNGYFR
jgi:hypothetical protein